MSGETSPYARELRAAEAAARAGGAVLLDLRGGVLNAREKADRSLLTDADLAAEREVLTRLREAFPGDAILSEEAGMLGGDGGRRWIVDPLDGTSNYSRGLPFFAVSVALWEGERPLAAAVYLPVLDELFAATAGGRAILNGQPTRVSETVTVREAMINVYFDRHGRLEHGLEVHRRVALACEGRVKNMGSTTSMLCYVACGRLDAFVRNNTQLWDFAGGRLILERAGGRLTDFAGAALTGGGQTLLASNGRLHSELEHILRSA